MKKPQAFTDWCKANGIPARSHDESVAWASWRECYRLLVEKFAEAKRKDK